MSNEAILRSLGFSPRFLKGARRNRRRRLAPKRWRSLGLEHLEFRTVLATVAINPIADATLYESSSGNVSNGSGTRFFAGVTNEVTNPLRRGLLKFDVASAVPAGARIVGVTLRLNLSKTISGATEIALHEVLADWGEGTTDATAQEGKGGPSSPNSATWLHRFYSTTNWASPGGVFTSTASAVTSVVDLGTYQWTSSQMAADVQKWLDSTPSAQFGWLAKAVNEDEYLNFLDWNARRWPSNRPGYGLVPCHC